MEKIKIEVDLVQESFSTETFNIYREQYGNKKVILVGSIFDIKHESQSYRIFFIGMDYDEKEVLFEVESPTGEKNITSEDLLQICKSICIDYYKDYVIPKFEGKNATVE